MRKLIQYFLFCILALLAIDLGLTLVFDYLYVRTKTGQTGGKINYYLSLTSPPNILIMGNSRSLYQIIPDSMSTMTYNLSHAGMGPSFQFGLLSILNSEGKMPHTILLHVEPYDFIGHQSNRDIQNLKYYYGKDSIVTQLIREISSTEKFKYLLKLYRYNGRVISLIKNFIQTTNSNVDNDGYEPLLPQPNDSINTLYSAQTKHKIQSGTLNRQQLELLNQFILMCRMHGTKVICFSSPIYNTHSKEFKSTVDSLSVFLMKMDVPYINYIDSPIKALENHPSLWRDANHLNHAGAQIESQALKNSVKKLLEHE